MEDGPALIGRKAEIGEIRRRLTSLIAGQGGLLLVAGEAGVGKTHLVDACLETDEVRVLQASAREGASPAYGLIVSVLRAALRAGRSDFSACGPLSDYLRILLPELGPRPDEVDTPTLAEAVRCAFEVLANATATVVVFDDLHWADHASLELLPELAESLRTTSLLIIGIFGSDEVPRGHPLRGLRHELRRRRILDEIKVEALNAQEAGWLAARLLDQPLSPSLAAQIYARTQGVPFFVEELALALKAREGVKAGPEGLELAPGEDVPTPRSIRDAVLLRLDRLPEAARRVLEIAAVVGLRVSLPAVMEIAGGDSGVDEALMSGLMTEREAGWATFRHSLTREAIYQDISWSRRRHLHRAVAQRLEQLGASHEEVADHWLAAGELEPARITLLKSADASCTVYAYRDAALAAQKALEIWPEGEAETDRVSVLEQLGACAEVSGMLPEAALAWREVSESLHSAGEHLRYAEAQRRLAVVYELQGAWEGALAARGRAAGTFASQGRAGAAAAERLAMAGHLQSSGQYSEALPLAMQAIEGAREADQPDLVARGLGLEGVIRAKLGQIEPGLKAAQAGLSLALEHNLSGPAAEIYTRLAAVSEQAADYSTARETYFTAYQFCETQGQSPMAQVCLGCLTLVLRQTGEWKRALELGQDVLKSQEAPLIARLAAGAIMGTIYTFRGQVRKGKKILGETLLESLPLDTVGLEVLIIWALAVASEMEGDLEAASEAYRRLLARWHGTEEAHYALSPLRWGATYFASRGMEKEARMCAEALATIAAASPNSESLSALSHALGELALMDGHPDQAVEQFQQSLIMQAELEIPLELAETQVRAAAALGTAGLKDQAVEVLQEAYRTAQRLGARPLSGRAAEALQALNIPLSDRLGVRAERRQKRGGLTRRQFEVLKHIAAGMTNKEIADEMVLSIRTVDMHVGNILSRLDSRSRAEAVARASEMGLFD